MQRVLLRYDLSSLTLIMWFTTAKHSYSYMFNGSLYMDCKCPVRQMYLNRRPLLVYMLSSCTLTGGHLLLPMECRLQHPSFLISYPLDVILANNSWLGTRLIKRPYYCIPVTYSILGISVWLRTTFWESGSPCTRNTTSILAEKVSMATEGNEARGKKKKKAMKQGCIIDRAQLAGSQVGVWVTLVICIVHCYCESIFHDTSRMCYLRC